MAASASNPTKQYPIWTTTVFPDFELGPDQIHCDEAGLKHHLIRKLSYNEDDADRVVQRITELFNNANSLYDFWKKATNEGTSSEVINVILQSIEHSQLINMLKYPGWDGYTALYRCAANKRSDVIQLILDNLSEEEGYQLLSSAGWYRGTPLSMSCLHDDTVSVRMMLNHINQDMSYSLLQRRDLFRHTPLHHASHNGHTDIINMIHESVTQTQWINLLQINGYRELPVLQTAAYVDKQTSIETIRESLSDEEWIQLLSTPLPEFDKRHHYEVRYQRSVSKIDDLRTAARVKSALLITDQSVRELEIQKITETESLTREQIQQLSPHSSQYIIPHTQKKSKRYGLVLFSNAGRHGAVAEADDLEQALRTSGCDVIKMEWSDAAELHNMIEGALSRIVNDCSLLIVCLMSHGCRGVLSDSNGKTIPVNDILHKLKQFPPTKDLPIPIVVLLQARQGGNRTTLDTTSDPLPTQKSDPHRDQHITLTRPHTVLLLATVRDGLAVRGLFTGAMAEEFRYADGKRDLNAMFTRAASKVTSSSDQQPLLQSTATKTLTLPPAVL